MRYPLDRMAATYRTARKVERRGALLGLGWRRGPLLGDDERRRPRMDDPDPPYRPPPVVKSAKDDQNERRLLLLLVGVGVWVPKKVGESAPPTETAETDWLRPYAPPALGGTGDRCSGRCCCCCCCCCCANADAEAEALPAPGVLADWERRTTLLVPPTPGSAEEALLLVGDRALPYGRETALPSRDRWARCCCRETPPPPEDGGGAGDCSIIEEGPPLLCRCLSTMMVVLCLLCLLYCWYAIQVKVKVLEYLCFGGRTIKVKSK